MVVKHKLKTMPDLFRKKSTVFTYLQDAGYDISRSQFYAHCRDGLLLPVRSGENKGKYKLSTVQRYASLHVKNSETGNKESEDEQRIREEKLNVSLAREKIGLEKDALELKKKQGKTIDIEDFERGIVARTVAFFAHLNHSIYTSAPDWVDLVDGDQNKAADLVEAISKTVEQRLGDFAKNAEFEVILEQDA